MSKRTANPVNPDYYQGDRVMSIIEDFSLDFYGGTILKYILRAGKKPGESELQDYQKALTYMERKIANLKRVK